MYVPRCMSPVMALNGLDCERPARQLFGVKQPSPGRRRGSFRPKAELTTANERDVGK
jgi:hypothetical protein